METTRLEAEVYSALTSDAILMGLLPKGDKSVFHLQAPAVYPDYAILVYAPISDVPVLHGDNAENLHRVTIRIHIITVDGEYTEIYAAIRRIMADLGFTRLQTTPLMIDDRKMLVVDFKIVIGG